MFYKFKSLVYFMRGCLKICPPNLHFRSYAFTVFHFILFFTLETVWAVFLVDAYDIKRKVYIHTLSQIYLKKKSDRQKGDLIFPNYSIISDAQRHKTLYLGKNALRVTYCLLYAHQKHTVFRGKLWYYTRVVFWVRLYIMCLNSYAIIITVHCVVQHRKFCGKMMDWLISVAQAGLMKIQEHKVKHVCVCVCIMWKIYDIVGSEHFVYGSIRHVWRKKMGKQIITNVLVILN